MIKMNTPREIHASVIIEELIQDLTQDEYFYFIVLALIGSVQIFGGIFYSKKVRAVDDGGELRTTDPKGSLKRTSRERMKLSVLLTSV